MIDFNLECKITVKHYLELCFGTPVLMRRDSYIGKYFYSLVDVPMQTEDSKILTKYETICTITISEKVFLRKGYVLSKTNQREFNCFVEDIFITQICRDLDALCKYKNEMVSKTIVNYIYETYGMDETIMSYDMIKKFYYRHRKRMEGLKVA